MVGAGPWADATQCAVIASRVLMRALHALSFRAAVLTLCIGASVFTAAFAQAPAPAASAPAVAIAPASTTPVLPPIQLPATIANPYGLQALWAQGDWVARVTLLILAIMSL